MEEKEEIQSRPETSGSPPQSGKRKTRSGSRMLTKTPESAKSNDRRNTRKMTADPAVQSPVNTIAQDDEASPPPEGCVSIFISVPTQKVFDIQPGENITAENPYRLLAKEDIVKDLFNRAAVCDFSVVKDIIRNYEGEELLLVYDPDYKHGNNFYLATTEAAKEAILHPAVEEGALPEEEVVYHYIPPVRKPWVNLGSDKEILDDRVVDNRALVQIMFERARKEFGAPVKFVDRNSSAPKEGHIEIATYEDKSFAVKVMEKDIPVSNTPMTQEMSAQTQWKYPKNAHTQYEPRQFSVKECEALQATGEFVNAVKNVESLFDSSLLDNEIMDFLYDDYQNLALGDETFTVRTDNSLKEFQSFTDLKFSKEKAVTCVQWHPTIKGIVAMSMAEKVDFDTRCVQKSKVLFSPSYIVFWSFVNPIKPQLLLEAPDDIYCFQFRPSDPNIVAGGCVNGQVVLWDIEKYAEDMKNIKAKLKGRAAMVYRAEFEDEDPDRVPIMRFAALSAIDGGHSVTITDLQWVPDHFEVNRMGYSLENKSLKNVQIITCGADHTVYFWDVRNPKAPTETQQALASSTNGGGFVDSSALEIHNESKNFSTIPDTFKFLDLVWKPLLKVHLFKSEPGGDHAPSRFSIQEVQGDRSVLESLNTKESGAQQQQQTPGTVGKVRMLQKVKTHFYVGTEDGELVYVDWMPQKDPDTGRTQTTKPDFYTTLHDGPINTLARCPFDRRLLLVIGGWRWSLWKEGVHSGPLLKSCTEQRPLTGGTWSPSRPSVFFVIRADGVLEIWDLLDKTHTPVIIQSVSSVALTHINPIQYGLNQLIAIGDMNGTLKVLNVPWRLRTPIINEVNNMAQYIERETKRRDFVIGRWNFREQEKMEKELEAKRKAGIAPNVVLTEDEIFMRMQGEYAIFQQEEYAYLRSLGLKDEDDEVHVKMPN